MLAHCHESQIKGQLLDANFLVMLRLRTNPPLQAIVEVLLRNPKHSQLLYRPNRSGETPYNIDISQQKTILGQIFGARMMQNISHIYMSII